MKLRPVRLAVVVSHPTQYYSPWFRWLAAHTGLRLRVFHLWEFGVRATRDPLFQTTFRWDVDLLAGYESEFVPNRARDPGTHHAFGLVNPGLVLRLARWRPDAILVFGYKSLSHLALVAWARLAGVPCCSAATPISSAASPRRPPPPPPSGCSTRNSPR